MLDRREFLLGSVSVGALVALPRCAPDPNAGPADGTKEHPYTATDPGPFAAEVGTSLPQLYGSLTEGGKVRFWLEVLNLGTNPPTPHPQQADHYIQELYILDEFDNIIAQRSYSYETQARLIREVTIPERVTRIVAIARCNQHQYWAQTYDLTTLTKTPEGDLRRPYTGAQPGPFPDKVATHTPVLGKREDGSWVIEVGDRAAGKLHETAENHYIVSVYMYDDSDQVRVEQPLGKLVEPVVEDVNVFGAKQVRIIAYCNLHFAWEAIYSIS